MADKEVRALLVHPAARTGIVRFLDQRGIDVDSVGDLEGIPTFSMGIRSLDVPPAPVSAEAPARPRSLLSCWGWGHRGPAPPRLPRTRRPPRTVDRHLPSRRLDRQRHTGRGRGIGRPALRRHPHRDPARSAR